MNSSLSEKRSIFWYELVGMVFVIILGSMLHFIFEWSGNQPIVGVFSVCVGLNFNSPPTWWLTLPVED